MMESLRSVVFKIVFSEIEKNPGPEDHVFNPGIN